MFKDLAFQQKKIIDGMRNRNINNLKSVAIRDKNKRRNPVKRVFDVY